MSRQAPRSRRGLTPVDIAALLAVVAGPPLLAHLPRLDLSPTEVAIRARHDPNAASRRNSSALASIMGELRASVGDLIVLKTERYMHSGVAYNAHINSAELATSTPSPRTSSTVPASTIATYGIAHCGEYCMATRRKPVSIRRKPSACSVQLE